MRSRQEIIEKLDTIRREPHADRAASYCDLGAIEALLWALEVDGFDPSTCGATFQQIADDYAKDHARA